MVWDIPLVSLGQLSQLCPLPAPCPPPLTLLLTEGGWREKGKVENKETLDILKALRINTLAFCYQYCFGHKSKSQHHTGFCEENWLSPPEPGHLGKVYGTSN